MKLLTLKLDNFQGIKELELDFNGASGSIFGDNATGKTTVYNSVTWLLFGKSSTGTTGFTPKTRSEDGEVHNLEHSVTASFSTGNGIITLQKRFHEVYKKKRGSNVKDFDGHTIEYFVNGVPAKEKEYTEQVNAICGDSEKAKLLTMPFYFPEQIGWQERRKILLDICGDVTDEQVIRRRGLDELLSFLAVPGSKNLYSVDEYRKIAAAQRKAIQQEMNMIPARIDEATKAMPETSWDISKWQGDADQIRRTIESLKEKRAAILSGDNSREEFRSQMAELDSEYAQAEAEHLIKQNEATKAYNDQVEPLMKRISDLTVSITLNQDKSRRLGFDLQNMEAERNRLLDDYNRIASSKWEGETTCPTCGQELPIDQVEASMQRFNLNKSNALSDIRLKGASCSKDKIEALKNQIGEIEKTVQHDIEDKNGLVSKLRAIPQPEACPFNTTKMAADIRSRKELLASCKAPAPDTSNIDQQIESLQEMLENANKEILNFRVKEQQDIRIKELEEREKQLAAQFEYTEKGLFLCDEFVRAKVEMLTDSINGHFKNVKFQLFTDQINGGLKETCEVLIPSPSGAMVPFATANNAARINAGLEIIGILSETWNIQMPVFIDNAEAVTKITPPGDNQTIALIVSEKDKQLRMVLEQEGQMDLSAFMNAPEV